MRNYFDCLPGRRYLILTLIGMAVLLWPNLAQSQSFSPFSDFQNMSLAQLATLQVKLTYVGIQEEPVPTVAFTSSSNTLDLSKFVPFRRPGISYTNDSLSVRSFSVSPIQLQALIQQAGLIPGVAGGGVGSPEYLSFALFNSVGGTDKGFEAILNVVDAGALLNALRTVLAVNPRGLGVINELGCSTALREPGTPSDVSASVTATLGGIRLNRSTGRFVGTAAVKNNSGASVSGPVSFVLILPATIQLFNTTGSTCGTSPVGMGFINFPLESNILPAGGTAKVGLDFSNPEGALIKPQTKVLAGPGAR